MKLSSYAICQTCTSWLVLPYLEPFAWKSKAIICAKENLLSQITIVKRN